MSSFMRRYIRELRPSLPIFLAHCILRRGLRSVPQVGRDLPVIVGIVPPAEFPWDALHDALWVVASCGHDAKQMEKFLDTGSIIEIKDSTKRRTSFLDDRDQLVSALKGKRRAFVIAGSEDQFPRPLAAAADAIIELPPVEPRHLQAGIRACYGSEVSEEEAIRLLQHPIGDIALAATGKRPWRRVLERLEVLGGKAAADDDGRPRLEDLSGLGAAAEWGRELITDLTDWKARQITWADIDRGILLAGPPGTGKTTFAKALAKSCGVPLVAGSLAQWQAKGHLGDLLKAMREAFDEARRKAPCILFIDEIDAFGSRLTARGDFARYQIEVINGLLECIDGVEGREGVVVVGACNHPEMLDPAVTRAGRLDRTVNIPLPDANARIGILRHHLRGSLPGICLATIAERTEGSSGADIEKFVREARRRARRQRREMVLDDLVSGLPELCRVPDDALHRTAVHEAGHTLVRLHFGLGEIETIKIIREYTPGETGERAGGFVKGQHRVIHTRSRSDYLDEICTCLGGLAAERIVFGDYHDGGGGVSGSDLHLATVAAAALEASHGLGGRLVYLSPNKDAYLEDLLARDLALRRTVDETLKSCFERAEEIISANQQGHQRLVEALLERGELSGEDAARIIRGDPVSSTV